MREAFRKSGELVRLAVRVDTSIYKWRYRNLWSSNGMNRCTYGIEGVQGNTTAGAGAGRSESGKPNYGNPPARTVPPAGFA